jgi:hypothetical protein
MNKPEIILSLGAEEGSLTLYGVKLKEEWSFLIKYERIEQTELFPQTVENIDILKKGFHNAIALLDRFPWESFIPRIIHPGFAELLLEEVENRIPYHHLRLTYWRRLIERSTSVSVANTYPLN